MRALLDAFVVGIIGSLIVGVGLYWPVMLILGALHSQPGMEWVPALGWWPTLLSIVLLHIVIPTSSTTSD